MSIPSGFLDVLSKIRPGSGLDDFLRSEAGRYVPQLGKLPEVPEEDRSLFWHIYGIPTPFMQVGTALGVEDPLARAIIDIAVDPSFYLGGGLRAAGRAAKAMRGLGLREATREGLARVLERSVTTGAHLDIRELNEIRRKLSVAGSDVEALKKIEELRQVRVGQATRALLTEVPSAAPSLARSADTAEELAGAEKALEKIEAKGKPDPGRLEAARKAVADLGVRFKAEQAAGKQAILSEREAVQKAIPGRESPLEFTNARLDRIRNSVSRGMHESEKFRKGTSGTQRALDFIDAEIANRQRLIQEGRKAIEAKDATAYKRWFDEVGKLDRTARMDTLVRQNRRNILALADAILAGGEIKPLGRTLAEQASLGQRALFQVPFGGPVLVKGAPVFAALEKVFPNIQKLGRSKQGPGLVTGAKIGAVRQARLLNADRPIATFESVYRAAVEAAESIKAVNDDTYRFQGTTEAHSAEHMRALFYSQSAGLEIGSALRNAGLTAETDWELIAKLAEADEDLIQAGELTAKAREAGAGIAHQQMAEAMGTALRDIRKTLKTEGAVDDFLRNYFIRRVNVIKDKKKFISRMDDILKRGEGPSREIGSRRFTTFYRHRLPRLVDDYEDLLQMEKDGIIELEKNPAVLFEKYIYEAARATANERLARNLRVTRYVGAGSVDAAHDFDPQAGLQIFLHPDHIPPNAAEHYVIVDTASAPEIVELAAKAERHPGQSGIRRPLVSQTERLKGSTAVLRQVKPFLQKVIGQTDIFSAQQRKAGFTEAGFEALERVNAFAKRGLLFWSMFHHLALTENAIGELGSDFFKITPELMGAEVGQRVFRGERSWFEAAPILETATRHGLTLGPLSDSMVDVVRKSLDAAQRAVGTDTKLGKAIKGVNAFESMWNRALWDYYQNALKLFSFETLYHRALTKYAGKPAKEVARAVAEHVNVAFGGLNWQNFWVSQQGLRTARMFLLAPDWTLSNILIATDIFANWFKKHEWGRRLYSFGGHFPVQPADLLRADVRATYARQFALRAGLLLLVGSNLANFAFTGRFMDQNPEGHKTDVQLPWDDDRGRNLFLHFGKQFLEPFQLVGGVPIVQQLKFLRRKLAALPNSVDMMVFGRDYYGRPIVAADDGPVDTLLKYAGILGQQFTPISWQKAFGQEGTGLAAGALEFLGVPVRTEFRQKGRSAGNIEIPPIFGDLTDELERSGQLHRLQDLLTVAPSSNLPVPF